MPVIIDGTNGISGVDGSASTPAVQGTDTNTGMFFPAADTIAFAEGGTEVMRIDSSGNVRVGSSSTALNSINSTNTFGFKNRIINGAMMIDQRNAGASVTATTSAPYSVDRWQLYSNPTSKFTAQQSSTAPTGFNTSLLITSSSAYTITSGDSCLIQQIIEGYNASDLGFGTANAQTVTISFWVRSSLTGTFGGSLQNYAGTRSYPFSYTISTANTWTQISITIAGDTSGTWAGASNTGLMTLVFGLGVGSTRSGTAGSWSSNNYYSATGATSVVGTNGATFYITGVQLEKGSTATSFDVRPYGTELQLCQRYYQTSYPIGIAVQGLTNVTDGASFICINTSDTSNGGPLPVSMRATPTFATYSSNGGVGANSARDGGGGNVTGITLNGGTTNNLPRLTKPGGLGTQGAPYTAHWTASAEL